MIELAESDTPQPTLQSLIERWLEPETRYRAQRYKVEDTKPCQVEDCENPVPEKFWFGRHRICGTCWHRIEAVRPWSREDVARKPAGHLAPGYAFILPILMKKARPLGYAVAVHGSMNHDLDVLCFPWVWDAVPAEVLVWQLAQSCTPFYQTQEDGTHVRSEGQYLTFLDLEDFTLQPHGRKSWLIQLNAGCHIDVSVAPLLPNPFAAKQEP